MKLMKDLKIKICGMRDHGNIMDVAAWNPDFMGFIFFDKSPRFVGHDFELPASFPASIKKVGVFVNASTEEMLRQVKRLQLDYLQLHGKETVEQVKELSREGVSMIKVFSVDEHFDFNEVIPFEPYVSFFLFDTKGQYYGGNAKVFDWRVLAKYDQKIPFFLSGGLTPENVNEVASLKGMNVYALDINSGVECSPGVKDLDKIKSLYQVKENHLDKSLYE